MMEKTHSGMNLRNDSGDSVMYDNYIVNDNNLNENVKIDMITEHVEIKNEDVMDFMSGHAIINVKADKDNQNEGTNLNSQGFDKYSISIDCIKVEEDIDKDSINADKVFGNELLDEDVITSYSNGLGRDQICPPEMKHIQDPNKVQDTVKYMFNEEKESLVEQEDDVRKRKNNIKRVTKASKILRQPKHPTNNIVKTKEIQTYQAISQAEEYLTVHTKRPIKKLSKNKEKNVEKKSISCDVCHKSFYRRYNLKIHYSQHSGKKPYSCDLCKTAFVQKTHLKDHLKTHSDEMPYSCRVCSKSFNLNRNLLRHMKIHSAKKPYACDICNKAFHEKADLLRHLIIHSDENPYSCDICKQTYTQKGSLLRHLKIHSGEKPFECQACKKSFNRKDVFKYHSCKNLHEKEKKNVCNKMYQ